jgi:uncharacterized protein (DUF2249 family)
MQPVVPSESTTPERELDVRPIIATGGAPIGAILAAAQGLPSGGALRLIAPFEPVPLYGKLGELGFDHATRARDDGAWEILFTRRKVAPPPPVMLDLRTLEPPEPLQRALEAATALPPGGVLIAITRFRPVHLLSILDERGLAWEANEQPDGSWETIVTNRQS